MTIVMRLSMLPTWTSCALHGCLNRLNMAEKYCSGCLVSKSHRAVGMLNSFWKHRNCEELCSVVKPKKLVWIHFLWLSVDSGPMKDSFVQSPLHVARRGIYGTFKNATILVEHFVLATQEAILLHRNLFQFLMCICRNFLWDLSVWDTDKWMYFQFWKISTFCLSLSYCLKNA